MSANFTVGRVGLVVDIDSIQVWSESGSRVTVSGQTVSMSVAEALATRQQFLGYVDSPDEDFVPVTWADQPSVDGFYRVLTVDFVPHVSGAFNGVYVFSLVLEKVRGFAAPMFESVVLGALRVNTSGIVTGTSVPGQGLSLAVVGYNAGAVTPTVTTRLGVGGDVKFFSGGSNFLYNAKPSFFLSPANWYRSAATLRVGSPLAVSTGRQVANTPVAWDLSNGLIRISQSIVGGGLVLETASFGNWVSAGTWELLRFTVSTFALPAPHTITVLRNSPEEVAIRLSYDSGTVVSASNFLITADVSLRRGAYHATVVISAPQAFPWGVSQARFDPAVDDYAALTGGFRTNELFNTHQLWMSSANACTFTNGVFTLTTAGTRWSGAIGIIPGGSNAVGQNTGQNQIYQFMAAQKEKVTVVAR